jgi:transcriptional regulator with XRE-family HTH domain
MAAWEKFSPENGEAGMKYHTMNNDEIILSLCARIRETRISLALTQQQFADSAQLGIATIKRIEKGGGLNLDTLISLLRALNKLHHLDAILFESEVRNFSEGHEGSESSSRLQVRQQAADLNRKASAPQSEEISYSAAIENTLYW